MLLDIFWVLAVGAAGLGAILGSFLNALLFRFNTGRGMGGRSRCMACNHTLGAFDLVPIFSWVFLFGRCRYCSAKISFQYPLVELAALFLSLGVFLHLYPSGITSYALWLAVWMTILFIVVYDIRHMIIPWASSVTLFVLAAILLLLAGDFSLWPLLAGPLLALPLFLISLVSRGRWMGWGDSAFELSLGMLLGLSQGFVALMLAVWSGALVGLALLFVHYIQGLLTPTKLSRIKGQGFTIRSEIPFGPFLALGAAITFFCNVDLITTLNLAEHYLLSHLRTF